jgi:hypothetical protein
LRAPASSGDASKRIIASHVPPSDTRVDFVAGQT